MHSAAHMTPSEATWDPPLTAGSWPQAPASPRRAERWIARLRRLPGLLATLGGAPAVILAARQFGAICGHTAADWQRDLSGPVLEIFAAFAWFCLGCSLATLSRRPDLPPAARPRARRAAGILGLTGLVLGLAVAFQGLFSGWLATALAFELSPMRTTNAPACIASLLVALGAALFLARQVRTLAVFTVLVLGALGMGVLSLEHWFLFQSVVGRAPHTVLLSVGEALAVLALATGTLCLRPREGVIRLLLSRNRAGMLARRLVPAGVAAVTLLAYLQLSAEQRWNFSAAWAVALEGMGVLIALLFITLRLAWVLEHSDLRRSEAERRMAVQGQRFRGIFDHTFQFIGLLSPEGLILELNRPTLDLSPDKRNHWIGQPLWEAPWWQHSDLEKTRLCDGIRHAAETGQIVRFEVHHTAADGTLRLVDFSLKPVVGANGRVAYLVPEGRDITELRAIEEEQRAEEARLRGVVEESRKLLQEAHRLARVGHWEWIIASDRFTWSPELFHMTGRDPSLLPPSFAEHARFLSRESWNRLSEETERAADNGRAYEIELEVLRPSSGACWCVFRGVPEYDGVGRLRRFFGTMQDVTERHLAEEARRESEARFRQAFEYSAIGFALRGLDGKWITVNRAFCDMLGYTEAELLQLTYLDVTHAADLELDLTQTRRLARNEITHYHLEVRYHHQHGHIVRGLQSATLVQNAAGQPRYYLTQVQDITQRHEAEELLRCQQDQLARFVADAPAAVAMFDTEMCYMGASERWLAAYAAERPKIMGRCLYDVSYQMKDGWRAVLDRCLQDAEEARGEESFLQPDGAEGWLRWEVRPWQRAQGGTGGLIIFTEDVTERRLAAARLKQSLEEKEVLLKEIHHRVKNNMQVVCSLLQLQSASLHDPADVGIMQDCQRRVHAMALVHDRLYRSGNFSTIDFGDHLRDLAALLGHSQGDGGAAIEVRTECAFVEMDLDVAIPLGLVAAELIINAFKHAFRGRETGVVTVSLVRHGEGVVLSIADDGVGMPPAQLDQPSRSLGLRLVRTLARQLRAGLTLAEGHPGAIFSLQVSLPNTTETAAVP